MRVPASTYRIRLHSPNTAPEGVAASFADVERELPGLADLGVGALHLSPVFAASGNSVHGYEIVDPTEVSTELGGVEGLRSLRIAAKLHGIGLILDIVPDRLCVAVPHENRWWWDVLAHGAESRYFDVFDLDDCDDDDAIAVPALTSPGDISSLELDEFDGSPVLRHGSTFFPIAPGTGEGEPQEIHSRQAYRLVPSPGPTSGESYSPISGGSVAVRQEDERVFELTHRGLSKLVREGLVDGVCIDNLDGLADPVGYTRRLRELLGADRWIVVDKTLGPGEVLDPLLEVEGTSGNDFLDTLCHLFLDPEGEPALSRLAAEFIGDVPTAEQRVLDLLDHELAPQLRRLARIVAADAQPEPTESSVESLSTAIARVVGATGHHRADYPVLATLLPWVFAGLTESAPELGADLEALSIAMARSRDIATRVARLTASAAALEATDHGPSRSGRLIALDAPGADPESWTLPVASFHLRMRSRGVIAPYSISAASPTGHGQRARARLLATTQHPERWAKLVDTLRGKNPPPARDLGYALLQHIAGHWPSEGLASLTPSERQSLRAQVHALAVRISSRDRRTPQREDVDSALAEWVDSLFDRHSARIDEFVAALAEAEYATSLAARAVQLLAPGVPELPLGDEAPRYAPFGPGHNSTPVDEAGAAPHPETALIRQVLQLRRRMPEVFTDGDYIPLAVSGPAHGKVLTFARSLRQHGERTPEPQVILVERLRTRVAESWLPGSEIVLPSGAWRIGYGPTTSAREPQGAGEHADTTITGSVDAPMLADHPVIILVRN